MTASPLRRWWWNDIVMPSRRPDFSIASRRDFARLSRHGTAARTGFGAERIPEAAAILPKGEEYGSKAPAPGTSRGTILPREFTAVFILERLPFDSVELRERQQVRRTRDNRRVDHLAADRDYALALAFRGLGGLDDAQSLA